MKKKIRFFITTLNSGGAERVLMNLLNWLDSDEYDVTLLTLRGGENEGSVPGYVHYRSILRENRFSRILQKLLLKLPAGVFSALFFRGKYDYEVAYLEGKPTAYVLALKTKAKKIAFVHYDLSVKNVRLPMYRDASACLAAYRQFDAVCFVSQDALRGFEKTFGPLENGRVVHNVIDFAAIREKSSQPVAKEYAAKGLKLVSVGRLAAQKNYMMLLSVFAALSREYDLELWIIGEGKERRQLSDYIEANDLKNVHLIGYVDNPYPYVKQADLYVCSSRFEGYNTAVLEATILGVPVLTTDCAGMSELLDGGRYGLIVENTPEALSDGIRRFARDPAALASYRRNLSQFSADSLPFAQEYRELFH